MAQLTTKHLANKLGLHKKHLCFKSNVQPIISFNCFHFDYINTVVYNSTCLIKVYLITLNLCALCPFYAKFTFIGLKDPAVPEEGWRPKTKGRMLAIFLVVL